MLSLQKIQYPIIVGILILITSCATQKEIAWGTGDFIVKQAFKQEFVSGMEDGIGKTMLSLELISENPESKVDSLEYDGKMYPMSASGSFYELNLNKGEMISKGGDTTLSATQALVYYHKGEGIYKLLIDPIETKDPIYMP